MLHSKGFKKFMAMTYGIGGAIVIIGALFKLMHWPGASFMLILGLGTEALIFIISAFEPLPPEELDWSIVYPELVGGDSTSQKEEVPSEDILSEKIDEMFKAAKLDTTVISKLTGSMNNLSEAAKQIGDSGNVSVNTAKYNKEINSAADHLEKINEMYASQQANMSKSQLAQEEIFKSQEKLSNEVSEKSVELSKQMSSLSNNISSLNNVYGGMLSAMGGNK